jgi:hypothetical protein
MKLSNEEFDATGRKSHRRLSRTDKGTGAKGSEITKPYKRIVYPFGIYEITIKLGESNEFLGILEVKANKDFMEFRKKAGQTGFQDVDEYYEDEE